MVDRADIHTYLKKKAEIYSDFLDNFTKTPVGDALAKVTNETAIKQSLKNLILTGVGERLFQPTIGCNVYKGLFEPNGIINDASIKMYVENTIRYHEPRVYDVVVAVSSDNNSVRISVVFHVINNQTPVNLDLNLRRVR
jgi:phage baseplate assembly protein W